MTAKLFTTVVFQLREEAANRPKISDSLSEFGKLD